MKYNYAVCATNMFALWLLFVTNAPTISPFPMDFGATVRRLTSGREQHLLRLPGNLRMRALASILNGSRAGQVVSINAGYHLH